jgi:uncharacterized protein YwgA
MRPRDWLLLLLALRQAEDPLDPVRLQKGMFLLAQEGGLPPSDRYEFFPYDYGPFSPAIYSDLEELVSAHFVREVATPGYTWNRYRVTGAGIEEAQQLMVNLADRDATAVNRLSRIKQDVLSRGFNNLLRYVYERYPDFASHSVFR